MAITDQIKIIMDAQGQVSASPPMKEGWSFQWCAPLAKDATWPHPKWWINPYDYTLSLRPLQLSDTWATTTDGIYARLRKSDFDLEATDFDEIEARSAGDWFLLSKKKDTPITSNASYAMNQGFYITFRAFGPRGETYRMLEFAFGNGDYQANLYSDGTISVGKLGEGILSRGRFCKVARNCSGELIEMLILPYGRRKILFFSPSHDGGFIHTDYTLPFARNFDAGETKNQITAAGKFTANFRYSIGMIQAGPCVFFGSDTPVEFITPPRAFQYPISVTQAVTIEGAENQLWDVPAGCGIIAGVREVASDTAFSPDGVKTGYRVKYSLSPGLNGDNIPVRTPFVYGARIGVTRDVVSRSTDPREITQVATRVVLNYGFLREGITGAVEVRNPEAIFADKFPHNRIITIWQGSNLIFQGFAGQPAFSDSPTAEARSMVFRLQSFFLQRAERTQLPATGPFDGLKYTDVFLYLAEICGFDPADVILPSGFNDTFPESGHVGYNINAPEPGDTVMQWLLRIEHLSGYSWREYGVGGTWKLEMVHPEDLDGGPAVRTFHKKTGPGVTLDSHVWSWKEEGIEPEVNAISIDFCDDQGRREIIIVEDEAAQNPTTSPNARPRNWTGERVWAKIRDSKIRTEADAVKVLKALIARPGVMDALRVAETSCEFFHDIKPGDTVRVEDKSRQVWTDWLVKGMSVDVKVDSITPKVYHRPCRMILERKDT